MVISSSRSYLIAPLLCKLNIKKNHESPFLAAGWFYVPVRRAPIRPPGAVHAPLLFGGALVVAGAGTLSSCLRSVGARVPKSKKASAATLAFLAEFYWFNRILRWFRCCNTFGAKPLKWGGGFCISRAVSRCTWRIAQTDLCVNGFDLLFGKLIRICRARRPLCRHI